MMQGHTTMAPGASQMTQETRNDMDAATTAHNQHSATWSVS